MPSTNEFEGVARRALHVFYVLDTSGSMEGRKIAMLNKAMEETVDALKNVAKGNADAELKIAVMEFNSNVGWMTSEPIDLEDFLWTDLTAGGLTQMGAALTELDDKLSRKKFLGSLTGAFLPIIIFMTDGYPTDEYKGALEEINKNKWFKKATKIGFVIGEKEEADAQMIVNITGNVESVIQTSDLELFARLIKYVSVTASMLASESKTSSDPLNVGEILSEAGEDVIELARPTNVVAPAPDPDDTEDILDFGDTFDDFD